uniref:Nudix hydrolase domain-containing protein n=1 Tax=Chlamydomonas leiostraca TaxID=1034604 RepID=A0A7S0RVA8_9CHLO|mmetsp:Transcript_31852/g.81099  ORF Transcript_31852/g.81099 Transcript_31852/m.81099 type:complete len:211 (+) Transcript_31852:58-690(+)
MIRLCSKLAPFTQLRPGQLVPRVMLQHQQRQSVRANSDRSYPTEPRVGVGVVVFRPPATAAAQPEVLLIKRGKEPNKGLWCFPGGSQELGETIAECAVREVLEETGVKIRHMGSPETFSSSLDNPTAFAAVDSIWHDKAAGKLKFHYAIIEVAALVEDPNVAPQALDDAADVGWFAVDHVQTMSELTPMCADITHEAVTRFHQAIMFSGR